MSNLGTTDDFNRFVSLALKQIKDAVNGGLTFSDNFDAKTVSVAFSSPNVTIAVQHGLGRVPNGYIVVGLSSGMIVFDGSTANTSSTIYLQSTVIGTAKLLIF